MSLLTSDAAAAIASGIIAAFLVGTLALWISS